MNTYYENKNHDIDEHQFKGDIFTHILKSRQEQERDNKFLLYYLPKEEKCDFQDNLVKQEFKKEIESPSSPLLLMGGANLENLNKRDIRLNGIKMTDPYGKIIGSFDIRENMMTYCPLLPNFYAEKDLTNFGTDSYFTTLSFQEIMLTMTKYVKKYYVIVGYNYSPRVIINKGKYIKEQVNKDKMLKFIQNEEAGKLIRSRILKK